MVVPAVMNWRLPRAVGRQHHHRRIKMGGETVPNPPLGLHAVWSTLVGQGRSYRLVGHELGLSKNTVADIVKRNRAAAIAT